MRPPPPAAPALPADAARVHPVRVDLDRLVVMTPAIRQTQMMPPCAEPYSYRRWTIVSAVNRHVRAGGLARQQQRTHVPHHRNEHAAIHRYAENLPGSSKSARFRK